MRGRFRCVVASVAILMILSWASAADAERAIQFDLPAQPLADSLRAVGSQTNTNVLFDPPLVARHQAPALKAQLTVDQALSRLLAGTGIRHEFVNERTVVLAVADTRKAGAYEELSEGAAERPRASDSSAGGSSLSVAQATTPAPQSPRGTEREQVGRSGDKPSSAIAEIGEVVVTGTHIRGVESVGSTVVVIDRAYIDRSGYVTVKDIVDTLPQSFAGGVNERVATTDLRASNQNEGSAINLRGLGASATLVLINGRRPVPGGFSGAFVDVSNIPSSAIERIEVLTDGASATYGSDAVAGVVNVILRKDYEGAETRARFGTMDGDADETFASQLFGRSWTRGNALVGYQYHKRDALAQTDRSFAADTDQRPRGGDNFSSFLSNPGNVIDLFTGQPAFAIPSGQDGTSLTTDDLLPGVVNYNNDAEHVDLLSEQEMQSAFLHMTQDLGERAQLLADGRYNVRDISQSGAALQTSMIVPASNPFFFGDPLGFGFPFVLVGYNLLEELGLSTTGGQSESYSGALGVTFELTGTWQLSAGGSYAEEQNRLSARGINFEALAEALADPDPATAFNPFGEGSNTNPATLQRIVGVTSRDAVTELWNVDMKADGALFALRGGSVKLAVGADYREEGYSHDFIGSGSGLPDASLGRDRTVSAAFAEVALPLVRQHNGRPGIQRLDVSLASRYEDYSDFGTTFNPKFGFDWAPAESLTLRGTWGTSFKAPRLTELDESPGTSVAFHTDVVDPQALGGSSIALVLFGNNEDLQEETATTWTIGFDLAPASVPGLKASLTYFDVDYEDRIAIPGPPGDPFSILLEEDLWADVVTRNPSQEEIDAICNRPDFQGVPEDCVLAPPTVIIDGRVHNLARTEVRGLDLSVEQIFDTQIGRFGLGLGGSYNFEFEQALSSTSPSADIVDTIGNPLALRLRGTATWNRGRWGAGAAINYADAYEDTLSQPNRSIDSWTTVDVQASYRAGLGDGLLENLEMTLSAVNVFNEDPPFANQAIGYDVVNANPYGRLVSLQVTVDW